MEERCRYYDHLTFMDLEGDCEEVLLSDLTAGDLVCLKIQYGRYTFTSDASCAGIFLSCPDASVITLLLMEDPINVRVAWRYTTSAHPPLEAGRIVHIRVSNLYSVVHSDNIRCFRIKK